MGSLTKQKTEGLVEPQEMPAEDSQVLSPVKSAPISHRTQDGDSCFPSTFHLHRIRETLLSCGRFTFERAVAKLELQILECRCFTEQREAWWQLWGGSSRFFRESACCKLWQVVLLCSARQTGCHSGYPPGPVDDSIHSMHRAAKLPVVGLVSLKRRTCPRAAQTVGTRRPLLINASPCLGLSAAKALHARPSSPFQCVVKSSWVTCSTGILPFQTSQDFCAQCSRTMSHQDLFHSVRSPVLLYEWNRKLLS